MSYDDDARGEPDEAVIHEGSRRLRTAGLTDEQVNSWVERVRRWGGRIELMPEGLSATYDRPGPTLG